MDCFVASLLAMTWETQLRNLAARCARVLLNHLARKSEGAGNAGCPMHPQPRVQVVVKHTSVVTTGTPGTPGIPRAMVLTAYFVLSPATNSSCHRRRRIKGSSDPVGPTRLRRLDTSNGCQDHTASPYAVSIVRLRAVRRSRAYQPALPSPGSPDAAASTASRPASVTIAIRPSVGWDGEGYRFDLGETGTEIFLQKGAGQEIRVICPSGKTLPLAHFPSLRGQLVRHSSTSEGGSDEAIQNSSIPGWSEGPNPESREFPGSMLRIAPE